MTTLILSNTRVILVSLILIGTSLFLHSVDKGMSVPIRESLDTFPKEIGEWNFLSNSSLSERVEDKLGVDDYLLWEYVSPTGNIVDLYVSYFTSMEGKGFHSPRHCMPGSGWKVSHLESLVLVSHHSQTRPVEINKMTLQKGGEKRIALYWYQCRGRIIRSEYAEKIYQVLDSILKRRTDGSYILISAPAKNGDVEATTEYLKGFAEEVIPILGQYIPGS